MIENYNNLLELLRNKLEKIDITKSQLGALPPRIVRDLQAITGAAGTIEINGEERSVIEELGTNVEVVSENDNAVSVSVTSKIVIHFSERYSSEVELFVNGIVSEYTNSSAGEFSALIDGEAVSLDFERINRSNVGRKLADEIYARFVSKLTV